MKQVFKSGDWVDTRHLKESTIKAVAARFKSDGHELYGEIQKPCDSIGVRYDRLICNLEISKRNEITVEECLFAGAPEASGQVVHIHGGYAWRSGHLFTMFSGHKFFYSDEPYSVIYTRQKQDRETVADASNWHERGELPPVGEQVLYTCSQLTPGAWNEGVVVGYDGNLVLVRTTEDDSNFPAYDGFPIQNIKPIFELQKIDMTKFSGSNCLLRDQDSGEVVVVDSRIFNFFNHEPEYNYWNAVKGLTEEPEWCKGFNVTVRYADGKEMEKTEGHNWRGVVAIRFDGVKEGYEL